MPLTDSEKAEVLRDAYRKHATELLAIEDSQQKLTTLLLAILGAGATFIGAKADPLTEPTKWALTVAAGATAGVGLVYTYFRHYARQDVRTLLGRCEKALGFETRGAYIPGETLYETVEGAQPGTFRLKGWWLDAMTALPVILIAAAFLLVTWSR
jgi:hypothetical protein